MSERAGSPLEVWRQGHHGFFILTQGLIITLSLASEALASGDQDTAERCLELAITLMEASNATMELATDFSPEIYDDVVRPSMQPPALLVGLSGLMSADHIVLVTQLSELRSRLDALEPKSAMSSRFSMALAALYDGHIGICEHFVGDAPSLIGRGQAAVQTLCKIKRARVGERVS